MRLKHCTNEILHKVAVASQYHSYSASQKSAPLHVPGIRKFLVRTNISEVSKDEKTVFRQLYIWNNFTLEKTAPEGRDL